MLSIRPFRNADPPKLVEIWRQYFSKESRKVVPLSTPILLEHVLSIPFFDREGLFLALDEGVPVGFAHASFGPNRDRSDINAETGVVNLIMIVPVYPRPDELSRFLLEHCEQYLKSRGAKVIFGGPTRSSASFYTGLYGGSDPIGVYESDEVLLETYAAAGYDVLYNTLRFSCDLRNFQTPFTPKSVAWRRKLAIRFSDQPPTENWFQSCTTVHFNWFESSASLGPQGESLADIQIRIAQPLDVLGLNVQIPPIAALKNIRVVSDKLHQGIGTFLLGETIRRLAAEYHPSRIETIVMQEEETFVKFLRKLGWKEGEKCKTFLKILQERRTKKRQSEREA